MTSDELNLEPLRVFALVAEMESFTRAADALGVQKGRISIVIQQLEKRIGTRLLHRTTRRVTLTEDGKTFLNRARDLLAENEALQSMFMDKSALQGRLRINLPSEISRVVIMPRLGEFLEMYPDLVVEISSADLYIDLVKQGVDCVIRVGSVGNDLLVSRSMGLLKMFNAASPEYLQKHGVPQTPDELVKDNHRMIFYSVFPGQKPAGWEYPSGNKYDYLSLPGSLYVDSVQDYLAAGLAGIAPIQLPTTCAEEYIKSGKLIEILNDFPPKPLSVNFVVAHRNNITMRVHLFYKWVKDIMKPYLVNPQ
ncbi:MULTISPECIES: LysR family transcriptional regulator [Serratia]|uniref:LysR family transcriptional regulator n=1 Tax=Serratia TaxID=613 RepID=UPI000A1940C0|nr:LysR family transcriptional regulator [Serratia marcescens]